MAHSIGLFLVGMAACSALLAGPGWRGLALGIGAAAFARSGGAWLHGALPTLLLETSRPPTVPEMAVASDGSLFSFDGLRRPGEALNVAWAVALENLAFACTHGKRNCLTGSMYTGELTLGKIVGLVVSKLSEGAVRCS